MTTAVAGIASSVQEALTDMARDIMDQYILGNKSTARAMFRQVPEHRKAFVTLTMAVDPNFNRIDLATFIMSVTE